MTGLRYGRLIGIEYSHSLHRHAYWRFLCDCGAETVASGSAVRRGNTSSCGCLHSEICAQRLTIHGHRAKKRHDATYRAWQEINSFCGNERSVRYRDFGAAGISVSPEWRSDYEAFLADMGERPEGTKLSRIDPTGDFTAANCEWIGVAPREVRALDAWKRRRDVVVENV